MANESAEAMSPLSRLRVETSGDDLAVVGKTSIPANLTNWSFGQLCRRVGAPAGYLESLPANLAAQNMNHGLEALGRQDTARDANLLFGIGNGSLTLRSMMTDAYSRFWNYEVVERLLALREHGLGASHARHPQDGKRFPSIVCGR